MTILAISLYLLGVIGCASAVSRDETSRLRKGTVVILWPVVVLSATIWGLAAPLMGKFRQ